MIYWTTYVMLTMWTAVTCASQNIAQVLVFRCLSGLFGSSPLSNAGGTIADVLDQKQRGIGMAFFAAAPFLGPALGPISGGFIGLTSGWRWVEGFLAIFCGILVSGAKRLVLCGILTTRLLFSFSSLPRPTPPRFSVIEPFD